MLSAERREFILDMVRTRGLVRLRDLTGELGVSTATVRRDVTVLAERGLIARVHGAIRPVHAENDYRAGGDGPDPTDQLVPAYRNDDLAASDTPLTLGMLVPSTTYYYPEVIRGARAAAAQVGARLVLGISHYHPEADRLRVNELLASNVDALMITVSSQLNVHDQAADWLPSLKVPTVLVERPAGLGSGLEHFDSVVSDHAYGACLAVRHLAALGHRAITLVTRYGSPNRALVEHGYRTGLQELGEVPPPTVMTPHPEYDPAAFDEAIREVTDDVVRRRITALVVHNDQDALVLTQRLHAAGVRVPEDAALVAYDDEVAALVTPPLTAIAPPKRAVGRVAVELLIAQLAHRDQVRTSNESTAETSPSRPAHHLSLLPELRIRRSCGARVR